MYRMSAIIVWHCVIIALASSSNALKLRGDQIIDSQGKTVALKGFNWFGFNNGQTMVDGLWSNDALSGDFATVVWRQKLLGFNAVRLPFSFKDFDKPTRSFVHEYCSPPSAEEIAQSVTSPGSTSPGPAPELDAPPTYSGNKCNEYLPNGSTRDRFIWVATFFAKNGFYVMVDNHLREDQTALDNAGVWSQKWADLVRDLSRDSTLKSRLIVDILNEPDNYGIKWPQLKNLYIQAMDAINKVDDTVIFAIEGTGQSALQANWGDGFATTKISELGLSDPRPFFDALLTKPYKDRVILAPHVYPPSVTYNYNSVTGDALYNRLSVSFGTKMTDGYCSGSTCQKFPVAIGEFGSKFVEQTDLNSMADLAKYLKNEGSARDGKHSAIDNWFYWSWNANSGDTGGLVDDGWKNIQWKKIDYLKTLGLDPWAGGGQSSPSPAQPSPSPSPAQPSPSPSPAQPSPSPSPAQPSPSPSQPSQPSPSPGGSTECAVRVDIGNVWRDGPGYSGSFNIYIKNTGTQAIKTPWELRLSGPSYSRILQAWNWNVSIKNNVIVGQGTLDWLTITPNNQVNVGFLAQGPSESLKPTSAVLNNVQCTMI
jgi:aryl-phospho-beta-D-glucosidase BglC (GH1 family)